jgi:hypothetical protein
MIKIETLGNQIMMNGDFLFDVEKHVVNLAGINMSVETDEFAIIPLPKYAQDEIKGLLYDDAMPNELSRVESIITILGNEFQDVEGEIKIMSNGIPYSIMLCLETNLRMHNFKLVSVS